MANVLSDEVISQLERMFREFVSRQRNTQGHRARSSNSSMNISLAKTTTTHDKGASQTIDLYSGTTKGSETTTGDSPSAYNRFADLATGKWCIAIFINGGWELIAGEC